MSYADVSVGPNPEPHRPLAIPGSPHCARSRPPRSERKAVQEAFQRRLEERLAEVKDQLSKLSPVKTRMVLTRPARQRAHDFNSLCRPPQ